MKRLHDWRGRLNACIHELMHVPFVWGRSDCAIALGDCIEAMTGEDLAANFRGKYGDSAGALKALNDAGFADLVALATSHFEEIHPSAARAGDIAAIPADGEFGFALGIFGGERIGVMTRTGYGTIARPAGLRAFRVP